MNASEIVHAGRTHLHALFQWGSSLNLLAANNSTTVLILCEHLMSAHYRQQMAAVQLTPTQLSITQFSTGVHLPLLSDTHIKGVCASKVNELSWDMPVVKKKKKKDRCLTVLSNFTGFGDSLEWQASHCV